MKTMMILTVALALAGWTKAAEGTQSGVEPAGEAAEVREYAGPGGERTFIERRLHMLREDVDRFDKRLRSSSAEDNTLEKTNAKLDGIKGRLGRLEERFRQGSKDDNAAYAIEEEIYVIDDELNQLRRDNRKMMDRQ